jgi:hypothetical protein
MPANPTMIYAEKLADCPTVLPEIKSQFDQATNAFSDLLGEVDMLDERLGYVSLSAPPETNGNGQSPADPERSTLAHNLHCLTCDINRLTYRLQGIRGRLEI